MEKSLNRWSCSGFLHADEINMAISYVNSFTKMELETQNGAKKKAAKRTDETAIVRIEVNCIAARCLCLRQPGLADWLIRDTRCSIGNVTKLGQSSFYKGFVHEVDRLWKSFDTSDPEQLPVSY